PGREPGCPLGRRRGGPWARRAPGGGPGPAPPPPRGAPLAVWITMNGAMPADPPRRLPHAVESWAHVGIGIGLQVDTQSIATRRGLARAAVDGRRSLATRAAVSLGPPVAGWVRAPAIGDPSGLTGGLTGWQSPAPGHGRP